MSNPRAILAAGNIFMDRLDSSGNPTGYVLEGSTCEFKLTPENEKKELTSCGRDNYGEALAEITIPGKTKISFTLQTPSSTSIAMAVLGGEASASQAAGSVTDESVTAIAGRYVALTKKRVSSVVVKDSTGATTYDEGDDYVLDEMSGLIKVVSGGAIANGDTLHISYSHAAIEYSVIEPNSNPSDKFQIKLAGKNFYDGKLIEVLCKKVGLSLSGDLAFGGNDFLVLELEGTCEVPAGESHAVEMFIEE